MFLRLRAVKVVLACPGPSQALANVRATDLMSLGVFSSPTVREGDFGVVPTCCLRRCILLAAPKKPTINDKARLSWLPVKQVRTEKVGNNIAIFSCKFSAILAPFTSSCSSHLQAEFPQYSSWGVSMKSRVLRGCTSSGRESSSRFFGISLPPCGPPLEKGGTMRGSGPN